MRLSEVLGVPFDRSYDGVRFVSGTDPAVCLIDRDPVELASFTRR